MAEADRRSRAEPTPRELEVLMFVSEHIAKRQRPPARRDIAAQIGVSSKRAGEIVDALVRQGLLAKEPFQALGISVTRRGSSTVRSGTVRSGTVTTCTVVDARDGVSPVTRADDHAG